MKSSVLLIIFVLWVATAGSQSKVWPGMTIEEVKQIYPNMNSQTHGNTVVLTREDVVQGLEVTWYHQFENEKLTWIHFSKYFQNEGVTSEHFAQCLKATQAQIKDFTTKYGKPEELTVGDTTYVNPYRKRHWGYEVMQARWKKYNGTDIHVRFRFQGSKGIYFLLFTTDFVQSGLK